MDERDKGKFDEDTKDNTLKLVNDTNDNKESVRFPTKKKQNIRKKMRLE